MIQLLMDAVVLGSSLERLDVKHAGQVHDLMCRLRTAETSPPGYEFSLSDVQELFNENGDDKLAEACGVFGAFGERGDLLGFVSLQPFTVDNLECLEFLIFFRPNNCRRGIALDTARTVIAACRLCTAEPIATLVFHKNYRAKRFYGKLGFAYDREVVCQGYRLELWLYEMGAR